MTFGAQSGGGPTWYTFVAIAIAVGVVGYALFGRRRR